MKCLKNYISFEFENKFELRINLLYYYWSNINNILWFRIRSLQRTSLVYNMS